MIMPTIKGIDINIILFPYTLHIAFSSYFYDLCYIFASIIFQFSFFKKGDMLIQDHSKGGELIQ